MTFRISTHATEQMKLRGVEENIIMQILNDPDQIILKDETKIYQSIIKEDSKQFLIRIFVNYLKTPNLVITVYKTSKIYKYYEGDL